MSACCHCNSTESGSHPSDKEEAGLWLRLVIAALIAGQSMIFGLAVNISPPSGTARMVLHTALALSALAVFLLVGGPLVRGAFEAFLRGKIVIEQLFLAGICGAFFASLHCTLTGHGHVYYEVVAILLAIWTFGQVIGARRRRDAREAARQLGAEFSLCELLRDGEMSTSVPVAGVRAGDVVRVMAGGAIPVDGIVVRGTAFVGESALTGESFPVVKREGDMVHAGGHALDQALDIRATSDGNHRMLDSLLDSVRKAQDSGTRLQTEADRLVGWFLPAVLVVSAGTFAGWSIATGWEAALFNALAVLVVACPCSMGLATPIGVWASLSSLARRGIMARSGDIVEGLARADTAVFDKTGTLGEERLDLIDFVSVQGIDRAELLREVGAVEAASRHPVAMGFRMEGVSPAERISTIPGIGIEGESGGHLLQIGNASLLAASGALPADVEALRAASPVAREGTHEVWTIRDGRLAGLGILRERLKESAVATLARLESMGLRCVIMTGDRAEAAGVHGFREVIAGMSPQGKADAVRELRASGAKVLFVGDGINDAPAMAASDASIAVSGGSALADETASATLLGGDLRAIASGIARCRATLRAVRFNLLFAAGYNFAGISLAAAGILHPVVAALLMLVSSMTVTWQVLRNTGEEEDSPAEAPDKRRTNGRTQGIPASNPPGRISLPGWTIPAWALGIALQGPMVVYLGGFGGFSAPAFIGLFAFAGALVYFFGSRNGATRQAAMVLTMFSAGGLLMLTGWWADSGFAAVVRDGVCLCGCADSGLGWGVFARPTWMAAGMLLAALPAFALETTDGPVPRWLHWSAGVMGMLLGMETGALLMALVPVQIGEFHFFATYAAMVIGMLTGMMAACRIAVGLVRKGQAL